MSGPAKDLFGDPNESACSVCGSIYKSQDRARECREEHERQERRQRARAFARTGVSQFKKSEVKS